MSASLRVAELLSALDEEGLARVLALRGVRGESAQDLFDVADALLDAEAFRRQLQSRDRITLAALALLLAELDAEPLADESLEGRSADAPAGSSTAALAQRLGATDDALPPLLSGLTLLREALVLDGDDAGWRIGPAVPLSPLRELELSALDGPYSAPASADERVPAASVVDRALHTGIAALALVEEAARQPFRELGKGGLSAGDQVRAAQAAGVPAESLDALLRLTDGAGLYRRTPTSWRSADTDFATREPIERWRILAEAWCRGLDPETGALLREHSGDDWSRLGESHARAFPLQDAHGAEHALAAAADAELLGVTVSGRLTPAGLHLLHGDAEQATATFAELLPQSVTGVYLQHDLSIVAMGPLRADLDARLRRMADAEGHGLASRYRITEASLVRSVESGMDPAESRAFLAEISLSGIPQPLDYLLTELGRRLGSLRLVAAWALDEELPGARSVLVSDDAELRERLLVDTALTALGLHAAGGDRISSPVNPDAVYWTLREARYPVAYAATQPQASEETEPAASIPSLPVDAPPAPESPSVIAARRLLERGLAGGARQAWIGREIERIVRAKGRVRVTIALPDGTETSRVLEPASVGGGRFRARDTLLDVERTFPISSVVRLDPAD